MDVVNGEIVSVGTERSRSDIWSALKPSCASVMEGSGPLSPPAHTWGASAPSHGAATQRGQAPSSMALEPGPARWQRRSRDNNILGQPHKQSASLFPAASNFGAGSPSHASAAAIDHPFHGPFQAGWKRSSTAVTGRDHYNSYRPCIHSHSVALFDEEMTMYESQISRTVSGHFDSLGSVKRSCSVGQDSLTSTCVTAAEGLEILHPGTNALKIQRMELPESGVEGLEIMRTGANSPKRRGVDLSGIDQDGATWIAPLRSLLRKELTFSDVGDLGRIVLPKKDAEGQLPQIDTKGKVLEMEEYSFSKRWFFQYKWWINNKSRMYVLENTGEFIKYHGLKAHDSFFVYEDGCGNLVVRGQKKPSPGLDSTCDHWK